MLNEWLRGSTVYSDAWGNDSCWLAKLFQEAGVRQGFKVDSIVALLSQEQAAHWHEAKAETLAELKLVRHRASNDAMVLQRTLGTLQRRYPANLHGHDTAAGRCIA